MALDITKIQEVCEASRASQNKIELRKVLQWVGEIHPKVILEVGVDKGYSLEIWNNAFEPTKTIGVEKNHDGIDWDCIFSPTTIIEGDSHSEQVRENVRTALGGQNVDFLWIDGDHSYEGVKKDYEFYAPLVRHGGIIGFHDIMLSSNEWRTSGVDVQRLWVELIGNTGSKYYEFWDEFGKGTGTGILYVK